MYSRDLGGYLAAIPRDICDKIDDYLARPIYSTVLRDEPAMWVMNDYVKFKGGTTIRLTDPSVCRNDVLAVGHFGSLLVRRYGSLEVYGGTNHGVIGEVYIGSETVKYTIVDIYDGNILLYDGFRTVEQKKKPGDKIGDIVLTQFGDRQSCGSIRRVRLINGLDAPRTAYSLDHRNCKYRNMDFITFHGKSVVCVKDGILMIDGRRRRLGHKNIKKLYFTADKIVFCTKQATYIANIPNWL